MVAAGRAAVAALLLAFSVGAFAQAQKSPAFEPQYGQDGKDAVWIPTQQVVAEKMLDMAKVTSRDYVIDLGSGDGRLVIMAAQRGARAMGVEYNPDMVALAKRNAEKAGVSNLASFVKADLFETDFSQASVLAIFIGPLVNLKLRPRILAMKPGTRVVSNTFDMGEWQADQAVELSAQGCEKTWCSALLWIVPARVAGNYKVPQGEVALKQNFQMLSGTLRTGGRAYALEGKVTGEEIAFKAGGKQYTGRLNGRTLELK